MSAARNAAGEAPPCAICGKPQSADYRPFCSRRCADVDLNRWLTGGYAIPVRETDDEDGEDPALAAARAARDAAPESSS